jgi:hypothetical protein
MQFVDFVSKNRTDKGECVGYPLMFKNFNDLLFNFGNEKRPVDATSIPCNTLLIPRSA